MTVALQTSSTVSHRRIAKGSSTWTAPVTLTAAPDPPSAYPPQIVLDPATEDLLIVWIAGRDVVLGRCQ